MRFTHKLTFGFGLVAALSLVMTVLFFATFRQYGRSNHLVFLLNDLRGREQALHTSMILELQAVKDSLERPDPALTDRARNSGSQDVGADGRDPPDRPKSWPGILVGCRHSQSTGSTISPASSRSCRGTSSASRTRRRWSLSPRGRIARRRAGSYVTSRNGSTGASWRWSRIGTGTSAS